MTERETGEFIATQKAMKVQLTKLEDTVDALHEQQVLLFNKLSMGRGFVAGMVIASSGVGAVVTTVISKMGWIKL